MLRAVDSAIFVLALDDAVVRRTRCRRAFGSSSRVTRATGAPEPSRSRRPTRTLRVRRAGDQKRRWVGCVAVIVGVQVGGQVVLAPDGRQRQGGGELRALAGRRRRGAAPRARDLSRLARSDRAAARDARQRAAHREASALPSARLVLVASLNYFAVP